MNESNHVLERLNYNELPKAILKQWQLEDLPKSENEAEARQRDIATRFLMFTDQMGTNSPVEHWAMFEPETGELCQIEIDATESDPAPAPPTHIASRTHYPLRKLELFKSKWVEAKRRGIKYKNAPSNDREAELQEKGQADFQTKCDKAIEYFTQQIALRTTSANAVRCSLPKKQQRKLGLLPPLA